MKKKIAALSFIMTMIVSSMAMATTWTDNVHNQFTFNNGTGHTNYSFTYDITGLGNPLNVLFDSSNPFNPGLDQLSTAILTLDFTYGNGTPVKKADISLDNTLLQSAFTIQDENLSILGSAFAQLNSNGTLKIDISRISGTFTLTDSVLTATGDDNTPTVPEPGTMMLLGFGMLSLAIYGKRRMNKEA